MNAELNKATLQVGIGSGDALRGSVKSSISLQATLESRESLQATLVPKESLRAAVSAHATLEGHLKPGESLRGTITQGPMLVSDCPNYEGAYEVRPEVYPQELETAEKRMKQNLLVQEIPYMEVTNASGSITVIIG